MARTSGKIKTCKIRSWTKPTPEIVWKIEAQKFRSGAHILKPLNVCNNNMAKHILHNFHRTGQQKDGSVQERERERVRIEIEGLDSNGKQRIMNLKQYNTGPIPWLMWSYFTLLTLKHENKLISHICTASLFARSCADLFALYAC